MIGNAKQADVAGAPWLFGDPLDRIVKIHAFLIRAWFRLAGGFSGSARVHAHAGIPARNPPQRIDRLPVHVRIGLLLEIRRRNPQFVFLVDAYVHDRGEAFVARIGTEEIGIQHRTVPHGDLQILLDNHRVVSRLRSGIPLRNHRSPLSAYEATRPQAGGFPARKSSATRRGLRVMLPVTTARRYRGHIHPQLRPRRADRPPGVLRNRYAAAFPSGASAGFGLARQ